jgi:hypothetical protein
MRRLIILLALTLGACGRGESEQRRPGPAPAAETAAGSNTAAPDDDRIACATQGAQQLERVCTLDRGESPKGQVLTLYSPDGSFRRLLVTTDGRGVVAADGAEAAKVSLVSPGEIEVVVARDRYRLPAHAK